MNPETPNKLFIITPNDAGVYTCEAYEFDPITRERTKVGDTELYRVATEADTEAYKRGDLKGRTRTAFKPENFEPFLLVRID